MNSQNHDNICIAAIRISKRTVLTALILTLTLPSHASSLLGLDETIVSDTQTQGSVPLVAKNEASTIWIDTTEWPGVHKAISDLQADFKRVTGISPKISKASSGPKSSKSAIIVGTLGKSPLIDELVESGKLDVTNLQDKWDSFVIETVTNPMKGVNNAVVIAGSNKRGTVYGIYELSAQLGVSPWHYWADVAPKKRNDAYLLPGRYESGEPKVKYRGIFINDEDPCLKDWAVMQFGGVNSKMYAHMFELMLRLRANYLWPAMWGKSIYEDDPESARLADEYGIVLGTSHHEPMTRAHSDWSRGKKNYGNAEWNYATNEEGLKKFFTEGIERNKDHEVLVTLGMRGDGDESMADDANMAANIALLEKVVDDQRQILVDVLDKEITEIPQVWALYKEVQEYYEHGMRVEDDITLLWADDNWGNIRRLPTPEERKRSGGAGVYYHFDYVGSPRNYKWHNTNPLPKVWEQMNMAYHYDATQIWVVNVGDLKPMELPIEFFMRMAWDPAKMTKERITEFTQQWAEREFGPEHAAEIADLVAKFGKYNAWRKPELIDQNTFNVHHYREAERVYETWQALIDRADALYPKIPEEQKSSFFQLVYQPIAACGNVAQMYVLSGLNELYTRQGRASGNELAQRVQDRFARDRELMDEYHSINGGKWNHMMSQVKMGYKSWNDPRHDIMPPVRFTRTLDGAHIGITIAGTETIYPTWRGKPTLPTFDSLSQQKHYIDVYRRGDESFEFEAESDQAWIQLSQTSGTVDKDTRVWVSIDWDKAPAGEHTGYVKIGQVGGPSTQATVNIIKSEQFNDVDAHAALVGPIAFEASDYSKNVSGKSAQWEAIPDYGRSKAGMALFPVLTESKLPSEDSPYMEYEVLVAEPGKVFVDVFTGISLNTQPDRGLRFAVSFNDQEPVVLDAFDGQSYGDPTQREDKHAPAIKNWHEWVSDNSRTLKSVHTIEEAGIQKLKIWAVDPGIVLEKIVVSDGKYPKSYFGPLVNELN